MSTDTYPYHSGDPFVKDNRYAFSGVIGFDMLIAWREARAEVLKKLGTPVQPILNDWDGDATSMALGRVIAALSVREGNAGALDDIINFARKFEVTSKVHSSYDENWRAVDREDFRDPLRYVALATACLQAYGMNGDLRFLNTTLKLLDLLCTVADDLPMKARAHLAWLIAEESQAVDALEAATKVVLE